VAARQPRMRLPRAMARNEQGVTTSKWEGTKWEDIIRSSYFTGPHLNQINGEADITSEPAR
jgi:hypothetical protein